jgi:hypothetical protein
MTVTHRTPTAPAALLTTRPRRAAFALLAACAAPLCAAPSNLDLPTPQAPSAVLNFSQPERWTVTARLNLSAYADFTNADRGTYEYDVWTFESLAVVFPILDATASALRVSESATGSLTIDDRVVDEAPEIVGPYHSGAMYARWDAPPGTARTLRLEQSVDMVTYETHYDEKAAQALPWPSEWPDEIAAYLQDDLLTGAPGTPDADVERPVRALVNAWTNGQNPRSQPPAVVAKYLAGKVQEHVRTVLPAQSSERTGRRARSPAPAGILTGLRVRPADDVAIAGEGTRHDLTVLLAAVYREAGIPARTVIGYRERDSQRGDRRVSGSDRIRSWVEFALWLPDERRAVWIPVDVAELRSRSSRMPPLDRPWEFFGTNDELDDIVPVSMHFHPPTTVRAFDNALIYGRRPPWPPTRCST